jgi:hypothetical protein
MAKRKVAGTLRVPSAGIWIAVEHEMPDSDINVLIFGPGMNGEPCIGFYDSSRECWFTAHGRRIKVTHWMEMIQPPSTWFEQAECLTWSIAELARSKQVRSRNDMDEIADDLRELADKIDEIDLESGE